MRTPKAKSAEPSARSASDCACPVSAKKHTAPAIVRSDPITKVTLGRSIVVRPVYHKLSYGNQHLPVQVSPVRNLTFSNSVCAVVTAGANYG